MTKFEKAILQAVEELGESACDVPIRQRVDVLLKRRWFWQQTSIGSLYVALDEMQQRGWIGSYEMPGGPERGYRAKRHWYLTRNAPRRR